MEQAELFALLAKSLLYTPIVYKQSTYTTNQNNFDNVFVLEFKHTELPDDSLLFFVPSVSSNDSGTCTLRIRVPYLPTGSSSYSYEDRNFTIVKETDNGSTAPVSIGDIIANRMCIFRFRKNSNKIILINSPLYNAATINDLKATNAEFVNRPVIMNSDNPSSPFIVATTKEVKDLEDRIKKLESKFLFGTEDPEDALSDKETGTVYIQIEKD